MNAGTVQNRPAPGYCECGCGQRTPLAVKTRPALGLVEGQPTRFVRGHHGRKSAEDFVETPEMNCWLWQLARSSDGYGSMKIEGRTIGAHRVYYEELVGPIPDGLTLDHVCRIPACVNPGHLEPVTDRENILRGNGPPAQNARKTHCIHGHEFTPENTRITPEGNRKCRRCQRAAQLRFWARGKLDRARRQMLSAARVLDESENTTGALHSLRLALTSLGDALDALGKPPTRILTSHMDDVFHTRETLADDRRMDRSMDREDH